MPWNYTMPCQPLILLFLKKRSLSVSFRLKEECAQYFSPNTVVKSPGYDAKQVL